MKPESAECVRRVRLTSGELTLAIDRADLPLEDLCGFASRRSRKRGFVFVSKVLGKHYPVRPRVMQDVYERLAAKLSAIEGPAAFIALAETATGLGHGVYEAWLARTGREDAVFLHTTRHRVDAPLALRFDEPHSHAPRHLLYEPQEPAVQSLFHSARTLVLIDDEISTGRTLVNLAAAFQEGHPHLESVRLVCLTDWLGRERRQAISQELRLPVEVCSLLAGGFSFAADERFDPGATAPAELAPEVQPTLRLPNFGRLGLRGTLHLEDDSILSAPRAGERTLVLGAAEFAYAPWRLARRLEEQGADVFFQSTTRSPLMVDGDLASGIEFADNYGEGIRHYLYNVIDRRYNRIVVCYETEPPPAAGRLLQMLGAEPVYFTGCSRAMRIAVRHRTAP